MKYYKIIIDNNFIGAINSNNFFQESATKKHLTLSDENLGQFVEYQGILYRDYWMKPIPDNHRVFQHALITQISEEEYNIFIDAINRQEEIIIEDDTEDEEPIQPIPTEDPDIALEYIRTAKLQEMSYTCRTTIENGFDIELRNETHHFSLDTQDQLNLISLSAMAQTQELVPYHADGESCIFYTAAEMQQIIAAATTFKIYHTTYYNALKGYINSLETIEEISAITYGIEIPDEYKTDVLRALEA